LDYIQPSGGTCELATAGMVMIDVLGEDSYEAIGLEVIAISSWLPLGRQDYRGDVSTFERHRPLADQKKTNLPRQPRQQ
jgi:hypothetical protein